ncbi:MAG: histidine kinase [Deltaproteobacteria bacterium]|nr:histidine kinase [Deltaproteobacteria bacterium]MBW2017288.1 histidine kinase [Deltaproteobacteria bacterium]MBW2129736.1 histidine kinase [Deltaproteobacteria bacterium]MBW2304339.1 histidine kinase [Deltaproteobacteria bacterium]
MNSKSNIIGEAGLQFFGKMSASISHEIKNALAIINESAGLLQDLAAMAEEGKPVDPQRLKTHAGKIVKQVWRADGIVKNMNTFAHSVDEPARSIDLGDAVTLSAALSNRFAAMRGIVLEVRPPERPVMIETNPFFLQNLLYLCLDFTMNAPGPGKTVVLKTRESEKGGRVSFIRLEGMAGEVEGSFPGAREKTLLESLGGEIHLDAGTGTLDLILPGNREH